MLTKTTIQLPGTSCQIWKKCDQKNSNASRDYNFRFRDAKLCELIAFIGMRVQDFRESQVEK